MLNAGDVETDFHEHLQNIINRKSKKYSKYLKKCNKCWLVIAALGLRASSFYEFVDEMKNYQYDSPFEKVFFLEATKKVLRELKVRKNV